jgi:autotransporter translocation and assembly factor TamB
VKLRKGFYIAIAIAVAISIYLFISCRNFAGLYVLDLAQKSYPGITVGGFRLSPFGLKANDVSWNNPGKPEAGFYFREIYIKFSFFRLVASIHQRNPLKLVSSVDMDGSVLRAQRSAAGIWSLPLPGKHTKERRWKAICRFNIRQGRVELTDEYLRHEGAAAQRHRGFKFARKLLLSDICASGNIREDLVNFKLDALSDQAAGVRLSGWATVDKPLFAARVELSRADPLFWHPYIVPKGLSAGNGKFDLKASISGTPQRKGTYLDYDGTVGLHGVNVALPEIGLKFENAVGSVRFGKEGMSFQGMKLLYHGVPLQADGTLQDYSNPVLDLAVSARGAVLSDIKDIKRFTGKAQLAGKADISMRLSGNWSSPLIEGAFGISGLSFNGREIGDMQGRCRYSDGMLSLPLVKCGDYPINLTGLIDLRHKDPRSFILAECRTLSLSKLHDLCGKPGAGRSWSGSISGSAVLQLQGLQLMDAGFLLQGRDIPFRGVIWRRAALSAKLGNEGLVIRGLNAEAGRGTAVRLYGTVDNAGRMQLNLDGAGLPWNSLGDLPVKPDGKVALSGSITGTVDHPDFNGLAGGEDFSYKGTDFKNFSGGIKYDGKNGSLNLKDMFIHPARGPGGRIKLTGEISAGRLDLEGRIQGIDVALLSSCLGNGANDKIKGRISGTLNVGGKPDHPSIKAVLRAEELLVAERAVKELCLDVKGDGKSYRLNNVSFKLLDGHLTGSGKIEAGRYALSLKGRDLSAAAAHDTLKVLPSWSGKLELDGSLRGRVDDLAAISGNLQLKSAGDITTGEASLGILEAAARIDHGKADYTLSISQERGRLEVAGTYYVKNAEGSLKLRSTNLPIKTALALYPSPADRLGLVDTRISGSLSVEHMNYGQALDRADLSLYLDGGSIAGQRLDSAVAEGTISARKIELHRLEVSGPALGRLCGSGWSDMAGKPEERELHFDIKADASDLPVLMKIASDKYSGKISMVGSIDGKWNSPVLSGSFISSGGSLAGYHFDSLEGSFAAERERLKLKDVYVKRSEHIAVISGYIPMDWHAGQISDNGSLDIDARLAGGDLGLVSLFFPKISKVSGNMEAVLHIAGKPGAIEVFGRAAADKGKAEVEGLGRIEELQAMLTFRGHSVDIEALAFKMGHGLVSGGGRIDLPGGKKQESALYLKSSGADVNLPWFKGRVDGEIQLSNDHAGAGLAGRVRISEGDVYLQQARSGLLPKLPVDAGLKLSLHINEGVRISSGNTKAVFNGNLLVGGSTGDPRIIGELVSRKGDIGISVISSPFRLVEARAVFSDQVGRQPLLPGLKNTGINLQARAVNRIDKTEIYMDVAGRLPDIKISFSSRPEMSEDEIIALLGRKSSIEAVMDGRMQDVIKEELIRLVGDSIKNQLFDPLGKSLADALGMGEVSFDYTDEDVLSMRLGRYIFDGLYVSYTTRIFALEQRNIMEMDYYLKNNLSLSWTVDDASESRGEIRWQYRF